LTFKLGINQFSDMTRAEYAAYNNLSQENMKMQKRMLRESAANFFDLYADEEEVAASFAALDWTGTLGAARDQGQCGSCWTFSSTAAVEGNWNIAKGGAKQYLSTQQLVDCDTQNGNNGCNGGLQNMAFKYIIKNGIHYDSEYPYYAKKINVNSPPLLLQSKLLHILGAITAEITEKANPNHALILSTTLLLLGITY